jgi:hypothetical protein
MNAPSPSRLSRSAVGRLSHSAIRRFTGRLSGSDTLRATHRFLRRNLWSWPIVAAVLFGGSGWWVHRSVEDAMRQNRIEALTTILNADVAALRVWMAEQRNTAELIAQDERLRPAVVELLALASDRPEAGRDLLQHQAQSTIRARLADRLANFTYHGFFVVTPSGIVLAADQDPPVGHALGGYRQEFFSGVMLGRSAVSKPYLSPLLLADEQGQLRANLPTMFAAATVRDEEGRPLAALGLRIRPDDEFTRILQIAQSGATGETYAFDRNGLLLSQSRFDDGLKQIGLLVDRPDVQSTLTLELRDPGVDMTEGQRPAARRDDQPLTRMASAAVQGRDGHDVDGYRDYRGVPVIGAWQWLEEYDFGVATEVDVAEAFRPAYILRRAFWLLIGLLVLAAIGIFLAMLFIARQQRALQGATLAARQLGQYALEDKLGAGGMGTVYRARHAMLRRPTAVKLLDLDKMSPAAVGRFEREVQLTSSLTHPNTVAIFDYGRTPEGIFYYAMEYLEGTNLEDLITRFGPLPEPRAVYVLRQVCGSLAEAHAAGLVHRDIKPANIFLTCRGGAYDFVKVLDFGLVKALESGESAAITSPNAVTGTPLYLSPEAVNDPDRVDARSDVYAIGAVGYFLLTGSPVFTGATVMEICMKHIQAAPEPPSARRGERIDPSLEGLLLRCLAKSPADRPADARALLRELDACSLAGRWAADDALAWWSNADFSHLATSGPLPAAGSQEVAPTADGAEALTVALARPPATHGLPESGNRAME